MPETSPTKHKYSLDILTGRCRECGEGVDGFSHETPSPTYEELQAENARVCGLCGQPDLNACLSNDEWTAITGIPAGEPGLRCIHCIDRLAKGKGLTYTVYFFWNGEAGKGAPYEPENPEWEKFRDEEWQRQIGLVQAENAAAREETAEYAEAIWKWANAVNDGARADAKHKLLVLAANPPNGESALKQLAALNQALDDANGRNHALAQEQVRIAQEGADALKRAAKLEAALRTIAEVDTPDGKYQTWFFAMRNTARKALAETAPEEAK